jgi:hypothetical protein
MRTTLAKLRHLDSADRRLLIEAFTLLGAIRLGLRVLPFRALSRALGALAIRSDVTARRSPERIAWAVGAASRRLPGTLCLSQALAAQVLLARGGHSASLRIGVATVGDCKLEAHAWLESEGQVVFGGDDLHRYAALPILERRPPDA